MARKWGNTQGLSASFAEFSASDHQNGLWRHHGGGTLFRATQVYKVLKKLCSFPFEPFMDVPLGWATRKLAFLIAICTAGRSSDLGLLGCKSPHVRFENNPKGVRFIPRNLRKQDRPNHFLQDMFVPSFTENRKLDPVRAISLYLKRVEGRRGNINSLFVTFGAGSTKSPSVKTIGRWIVEAISECVDPGSISTRKTNVKQGVKAHSTRSVSTSVALLRGCKIENILKAADWSSSSVFAKHYLRDVREKDAEFGRTVLRGSQ